MGKTTSLVHITSSLVTMCKLGQRQDKNAPRKALSCVRLNFFRPFHRYVHVYAVSEKKKNLPDSGRKDRIQAVQAIVTSYFYII